MAQYYYIYSLDSDDFLAIQKDSIKQCKYYIRKNDGETNKKLRIARKRQLLPDHVNMILSTNGEMQVKDKGKFHRVFSGWDFKNNSNVKFIMEKGGMEYVDYIRNK